MKIAENIRNMRRERRMTQEQLAEALGVTVGAVYKWESGRSTPEISLIVEMADLFEISVDVLLGYEVRNNDRAHIVKRLRDHLRSKTADKGITDAQKALQKYPNHFDVVYYCAKIYHVVSMERRDQKLASRALELFQHAGLLMDQNTDEEISELSIQVQMAEVYAELGKYDRAIELLKKNNPLSINSAQIGEMLAAPCNRFDEAIPYLSQALVDSIVAQVRVATGYINIYLKRAQYERLLEVTQWILGAIGAFVIPNETNVLDKMRVTFLAVQAEAQLRLGQKENAADSLRQAWEIAGRFDRNPDYSVNRIRFVTLDRQASAYDNMGATAMESIQNAIDEEEYAQLSALWEEVKHEQA